MIYDSLCNFSYLETSNIVIWTNRNFSTRVNFAYWLFRFIMMKERDLQQFWHWSWHFIIISSFATSFEILTNISQNRANLWRHKFIYSWSWYYLSVSFLYYNNEIISFTRFVILQYRKDIVDFFQISRVFIMLFQVSSCNLRLSLSSAVYCRTWFLAVWVWFNSAILVNIAAFKDVA